MYVSSLPVAVVAFSTYSVAPVFQLSPVTSQYHWAVPCGSTRTVDRRFSECRFDTSDSDTQLPGEPPVMRTAYDLPTATSAAGSRPSITSTVGTGEAGEESVALKPPAPAKDPRQDTDQTHDRLCTVSGVENWPDGLLPCPLTWDEELLLARHLEAAHVPRALHLLLHPGLQQHTWPRAPSTRYTVSGRPGRSKAGPHTPPTRVLAEHGLAHGVRDVRGLADEVRAERHRARALPALGQLSRPSFPLLDREEEGVGLEAHEAEHVVEARQPQRPKGRRHARGHGRHVDGRVLLRLLRDERREHGLQVDHEDGRVAVLH